MRNFIFSAFLGLLSIGSAQARSFNVACLPSSHFHKGPVTVQDQTNRDNYGVGYANYINDPGGRIGNTYSVFVGCNELDTKQSGLLTVFHFSVDGSPASSVEFIAEKDGPDGVRGHYKVKGVRLLDSSTVHDAMTGGCSTLSGGGMIPHCAATFKNNSGEAAIVVLNFLMP